MKSKRHEGTSLVGEVPSNMKIAYPPHETTLAAGIQKMKTVNISLSGLDLSWRGGGFLEKPASLAPFSDKKASPAMAHLQTDAIKLFRLFFWGVCSFNSHRISV
jgi:hypothetical protein